MLLLYPLCSYPVLWQSRLGFARVALAAGRPIVPVFTENIRENTRSLAGRMTLGRSEYRGVHVQCPVLDPTLQGCGSASTGPQSCR